MQSHSLSTDYHYIRVSIFPPTQDILTLRKTMSDALAECFGITSGSMYLDILSLESHGKECLVRTRNAIDARKVVAALAVAETPVRLALIMESPFLPSLLNSEKKRVF